MLKIRDMINILTNTLDDYIVESSILKYDSRGGVRQLTHPEFLRLYLVELQDTIRNQYGENSPEYFALLSYIAKRKS